MVFFNKKIWTNIPKAYGGKKPGAYRQSFTVETGFITGSHTHSLLTNLASRLALDGAIPEHVLAWAFGIRK